MHVKRATFATCLSVKRCSNGNARDNERGVCVRNIDDMFVRQTHGRNHSMFLLVKEACRSHSTSSVIAKLELLSIPSLLRSVHLV